MQLNRVWTYRPELDGLRAIAVVAVILFHAGGILPGGFVGVDVFFTLSGYLVTGVITAQLETGGFSLRLFWMRRIRRLMPAALLVSGVCLAWGYLYLLPEDLRSLARSNLAQLVFLANVNFWLVSGYFAEAAHTKPLLHYWSLAVEEQFYLILPPLLILIWGLASRARLGLVALAGAASFVLSVYASYAHPEGNFYLLPTRSWELLVGSGLALVSRTDDGHDSALRRPVAGWVGLSAILYSASFYDESTRFPGLAALLPVFGTALIIWTAGGSSPSAVTRLLAARPMVSIGKLSYSLYLWHWPCLALLAYEVSNPSVLAQVACLATSAVLAIGAYLLVENPIRRRLWVSGDSSLIKLVLVAGGTQALVAAWLYESEGCPSRLGLPQGEVLSRDMSWIGERSTISGDRISFVDLNPPRLSRPDFVVWGDSHAAVMQEVVASVASEFGRRGLGLAISNTPPGIGCWRPAGETREAGLRLREIALSEIEAVRPSVVVFAARWQAYANAPDPSDDYWLDGDPAQADSRAVLQASLGRAVERVEQIGARCIFIRQVAELDIMSPAREVAFAVLARQDLPDPLISAGAIARHYERRLPLDDLFEELSLDGRVVLDPSAALWAKAARPVWVSRGVSLYRDDDHLSFSGARALAAAIREELRRAMGW